MEFLKSMLKSENRRKIKKPRKDQLVILLLFGVLLLVIAIPVEPKKERKTGTEAQENAAFSDRSAKREGTLPEDSYERQQEERLKEVLQKVEGVGRAEVMITLQASSEKIVEKDIPSQSRTVEEGDAQGGSRVTQESERQESTVYQEAEDGSRTPYVVQELEPKVEGVLVIAEGGGSPAVRQNILEAVQALFPVEAHKIKIMKMEGSK